MSCARRRRYRAGRGLRTVGGSGAFEKQRYEASAIGSPMRWTRLGGNSGAKRFTVAVNGTRCRRWFRQYRTRTMLRRRCCHHTFADNVRSAACKRLHTSHLTTEHREQVLPPPDGWRRLRDMQRVVAYEPAVAHAVRCMPLYDQLELTLQLLQQDDWPQFDYLDPLPPNVVRPPPSSAALAVDVTPSSVIAFLPLVDRRLLRSKNGSRQPSAGGSPTGIGEAG
jgi:hypothetical protein